MSESRVRSGLSRAALGAAALGCVLLAGCHTTRPLGAEGCAGLTLYQRPRDSDDAIRIAKRMIAEVYGAPAMLRQEPYAVRLDQDRWVVHGTVPPGQAGAPYLIMIDARAGCPVYVGMDQ